MTRFPESTSNEPSIHAALGLSKNRWLLAIQAPGWDNPSLHPIKGGDAEGLMAKLEAARGRSNLSLDAEGITIPFPQRDVHLFEEKTL